MSSTRRSSRIAIKRFSTSTPETLDNEDDVEDRSSLPYEPEGDDINDALESRGAKKRKSAHNANNVNPVRRKKGILSSALIMLPNEVMCEICSYLYPNDLLHVSQSSKIFAAFLLAPSSAAVWRAARLQLDGDFPECPEDLTEQKYACLVFGKTCQRCGKKLGVRGPSCNVWVLRRHWCTVCRTEIQIGRDPKYSLARAASRIDHLVNIGYLTIGGRHRIIDRTEASEAISLLDDSAIDADIRTALKEKRIADVANRREHAVRLDAWIRRRANNRAGELSELRSQRLDDLKGFLVKTGFERGLLDYLHPTIYHRLPTMKQSKRLKQSAWKAIEEEVTATISTEIRRLIAQAAFKAHELVVCHVIQFRAQRRPSRSFLPCGEVVVRAPEVKSVVEKWATRREIATRLLGTSPSSGPVVDLPPEVINLIPQVVERMQREIDEHFSQALPSYKTLREEMSTSEMLDLATSVFTDNPPPRIGVTIPQYCIPYYLTYRIHNSMPYTSTGLQVSRDLKECWVYDRVSAAIIKEIVLGCGFDARTCTHAQLEEVEPYVFCLTCYAGGTSYAMRWDQAHFHWRTAHRDTHESGSAWRVLSAKEKEVFRDIWGSKYSDRGQSQYECLLCSQLRLRQYTILGLQAHLQLVHDTKDASDPRYRVYSRQRAELAPIAWDPSTALC